MSILANKCNSQCFETRMGTRSQVQKLIQEHVYIKQEKKKIKNVGTNFPWTEKKGRGSLQEVQKTASRAKEGKDQHCQLMGERGNICQGWGQPVSRGSRNLLACCFSPKQGCKNMENNPCYQQSNSSLYKLIIQTLALHLSQGIQL